MFVCMYACVHVHVCVKGKKGKEKEEEMEDWGRKIFSCTP